MTAIQKLVILFGTLLTKLLNFGSEPTQLKVRVGVVEDTDLDNYVEVIDNESGTRAYLTVHFDNAFDYLPEATEEMVQAILNSLLKLGFRVAKLYWGEKTHQFFHYPEIVLYDRLRINRFRLPETIDVVKSVRKYSSKKASVVDTVRLNKLSPLSTAFSKGEAAKVLVKNTGTEFDNQTFHTPVVDGVKVGLGQVAPVLPTENNWSR